MVMESYDQICELHLKISLIKLELKRMEDYACVVRFVGLKLRLWCGPTPLAGDYPSFGSGHIAVHADSVHPCFGTGLRWTPYSMISVHPLERACWCGEAGFSKTLGGNRQSHWLRTA